VSGPVFVATEREKKKHIRHKEQLWKSKDWGRTQKEKKKLTLSPPGFLQQNSITKPGSAGKSPWWPARRSGRNSRRIGPLEGIVFNWRCWESMSIYDNSCDIPMDIAMAGGRREV
jgi:hypothetical protein